MNAHSYVVWSQPHDELADDVLSLDGADVDPADDAQRQEIVSWVSDLASSPGRRDLVGGGFLIRGPDGAVAEVPVDSPYTDFAPMVSIALGVGCAGAAGLTDTVSAEVVRVADLAGHTADADRVRPVVRQLVGEHRSADLLRRWRRLLAWLAAWFRQWAEEG